MKYKNLNLKIVESDFKKKKVIVGRKIKKKVEKISVTSKHVKIPSQMINRKNGQNSSESDETMTRLIKQLSHPNASTREYSLEEIRKLMKKKLLTTSFVSHISLLFPSITECIFDEESKVRKGLINLFISLLPDIQSENLGSVFPVVVTYIISGMTHLKKSIRKDSMRILLIFCKFHPICISDFSEKILSLVIDLLEEQSSTLSSMSNHEVIVNKNTVSSSSGNKNLTASMNKNEGNFLFILMQTIRYLLESHILLCQRRHSPPSKSSSLRLSPNTQTKNFLIFNHICSMKSLSNVGLKNRSQTSNIQQDNMPIEKILIDLCNNITKIWTYFIHSKPALQSTELPMEIVIITCQLHKLTTFYQFSNSAVDKVVMNIARGFPYISVDHMNNMHTNDKSFDCIIPQNVPYLNLVIFELIIDCDWVITPHVNLHSFINGTLENLVTFVVSVAQKKNSFSNNNNLDSFGFSDAFISKLFNSFSIYIRKLFSFLDSDTIDANINLKEISNSIFLFSETLCEIIRSSCHIYENISKKHLLYLEQLVVLLEIMSTCFTEQTHLHIHTTKTEIDTSNLQSAAFIDSYSSKYIKCIADIESILQIVPSAMISILVVNKIRNMIASIFININFLNILSESEVEMLYNIPVTLLNIISSHNNSESTSVSDPSKSHNQIIGNEQYINILNLFYYCRFSSGNLYEVALTVSLTLLENNQYDAIDYFVRVLFEKRKEFSSPTEFVELVLYIATKVASNVTETSNTNCDYVLTIFQCIANTILNCSSSETPEKLLTFIKPFIQKISECSKEQQKPAELSAFLVLEIILAMNLLKSWETEFKKLSHCNIDIELSSSSSHIQSNAITNINNTACGYENVLDDLLMNLIVLNLKKILLTFKLTDHMAELICEMLKKTYYNHMNKKLYNVAQILTVQIQELLQDENIENRSLDSDESLKLLIHNIRHIILKLKCIKLSSFLVDLSTVVVDDASRGIKELLNIVNEINSR